VTYYNTNKLQGEQLLLFEEKTKTQAERILEFMRFTKRKHTPSQIHQQVFGQSVPITSVRRAMTDLTDDGHLYKTDIMVDGPYGNKEHCWVAL
jgi:hypothetical protein